MIMKKIINEMEKIINENTLPIITEAKNYLF